MENPRPEKVAVVEEVRGRLDASSAAVLTEYRGLSVSDMADLRRALTSAGAEYKIYKNTLVRLAVAGGPHAHLEPLLTGPTGIAFVSGEITAVAKALRDYARTNPNLVLKGGVHGEALLSTQELGTLADLPSREVLLARVAGGLSAPLQQLAGLMQALTRNLAYGLKALVEQKGGEVLPNDAGSGTASEETASEATASEATASEAEAEESPEAPQPEASVTAPAPETEETAGQEPPEQAPAEAQAPPEEQGSEEQAPAGEDQGSAQEPAEDGG